MPKSINKGEVRNENYYFDDDNYAHFDQAWTLNVNANYAYSKVQLPEHQRDWLL
jgi:hypothetical protein